MIFNSYWSFFETPWKFPIKSIYANNSSKYYCYSVEAVKSVFMEFWYFLATLALNSEKDNGGYENPRKLNNIVLAFKISKQNIQISFKTKVFTL